MLKPSMSRLCEEEPFDFVQCPVAISKEIPEKMPLLIFLFSKVWDTEQWHQIPSTP